ncbi:MAG: hypothetical protein K2W96_00495 [Gemmataceae bacterium]|nr:hypothetical protein [Gemmataceae bacterium]
MSKRILFPLTLTICGVCCLFMAFIAALEKDGSFDPSNLLGDPVAAFALVAPLAIIAVSARSRTTSLAVASITATL